MRIYITAEQAISILPDGESVHTFYNPGFGLVGADWSRESMIDKLRKSDFRELTGDQARSMNKGLCVYDKTTKYQGDILFVETDHERLDKLESELQAAQAVEDDLCSACEDKAGLEPEGVQG